MNRSITAFGSKVLPFAVLILFLLSLNPAHAETACPQHFAGGGAPAVTNPRMQLKTRELCFSGFAVLHSGITRTPLYSAEHLTRASVTSAREQVRIDEFHPEPRLPGSERAELRDYSRSGLDRGHMSPSGDASSPEAQAETFTLANMVPQNPDNNRGIWSEIEGAVRDMAQRRGELYVITGPLYEAENLQMLKRRVLVPTSLFKLVYDPAAGRAAAYVSPNDSSGSYSVVSVAELERRSGLQLLPAASGVLQRAPLDLPTPRARRGGRRHGGSYEGGRRASHSMYSVSHPLRALARELLR